MDFLANTICLSTNLPPSVLLQMKVGGADTRRDLAMAQRVTGNWQQDFASQFQRHYEFVIQAAIESGDLTDPPVDWRQVSWQMPKDLTVDAGREAAQDREDVKMGLMTRREYFGRFQLVAKRETNQFLDEVADILKGAEERGIPPQYIGFGNPNSLPSMPPNSSIRSSSKQEEEQEDEEETREPVLASDE
jgi:hypothetical protein